MDPIKISNVDAATIAMLDQKAKDLSLKGKKRISRNMLIKAIIEKAMVNESMLSQFEEINELRKEIIELKEVLNEYVESNNFIVQALLTGEVGEYK